MPYLEVERRGRGPDRREVGAGQREPQACAAREQESNGRELELDLARLAGDERVRPVEPRSAGQVEEAAGEEKRAAVAAEETELRRDERD